jgi:hypothetical protein
MDDRTMMAVVSKGISVVVGAALFFIIMALIRAAMKDDQ